MTPADRIRALCCCDAAYRDRGMHAPGCVVDDAAEIAKQAVAAEREACRMVAAEAVVAYGARGQFTEADAARGIRDAIAARGEEGK